MSSTAKTLALSIQDCVTETGINMNALYEAVRDGALTARKVGRRTVILRADLEAYLKSLPRLDLNEGRYTPKCRNRPVGRRKRSAATADAAA
jgi:hypothetical protein